MTSSGDIDISPMGDNDISPMGSAIIFLNRRDFVKSLFKNRNIYSLDYSQREQKQKNHNFLFGGKDYLLI